MTRTLRATAISLAATLAATLGLTQPAWAAGYSASLTTAVAGLPVATEVRTGYNRDLFPHWIDADSDGCNTRNEVLLAEAVSAPTVSGTCTLSGGRWYSYYDNAYWTLTSDLDIDHMVPLAEAWDSGARNWTTSRRQAYANDLGDGRALAAVGHLDAAVRLRPVPLPQRVGGGEDPLAAHRRQRRGERPDQLGEQLPQRHHLGHLRVLTASLFGCVRCRWSDDRRTRIRSGPTTGRGALTSSTLQLVACWA